MFAQPMERSWIAQPKPPDDEIAREQRAKRKGGEARQNKAAQYECNVNKSYFHTCSKAGAIAFRCYYNNERNGDEDKSYTNDSGNVRLQLQDRENRSIEMNGINFVEEKE